MPKLKAIKTSSYLSYGIDRDEGGKSYCYLQTAHDHGYDIELFRSNAMALVVLVGKMLCAVFGKRLERW